MIGIGDSCIIVIILNDACFAYSVESGHVFMICIMMIIVSMIMSIINLNLLILI